MKRFAPGNGGFAGEQLLPGSATPLRGLLTGGKHLLRPGLASSELTRAQNSHLRQALVRRRSASVPARSSGKHSLAGDQLLPGSATPLRGALTGGKHLLRPGLASSELTRAQNAHLRQALVRRRSASVPALSSGKHSLAGEQLLPGTSTPLRRALTGGNHLLRPGLASPELTRAQNAHLRRALVRRRSASVPARSSGKHSLAGEQLLPGTSTPLRRALTGGNHLLR